MSAETTTLKAGYALSTPDFVHTARARLRRGITVIETSIAIAIGLVVLAGLVVLGYGLLRDAEISATVDDFTRIPQAMKSLGANQSFYSASDSTKMTAVIARLKSIPDSVKRGTTELILGDDELPVNIWSGGGTACDRCWCSKQTLLRSPGRNSIDGDNPRRDR